MAEAPVSNADTADFTFQIAELDTLELRVLGFEGTEGISELYRFKVELCSDDANIDLAALLGKACSLEIYALGGLRRYISGIVRRFERMGHGSGLTYYVAEIVPALWLLTKRYQSRIFQETRCSDMTIPGVFAKVIEDAGITKDYFDPPMIDASRYEAHEFIAQYGESDFDFISRLMEHEGIFYFFEHAADGHRMLIGDDDSAHNSLPEVDEFPYRDPSGLIEEKEYFFSARDAREIQHGAVYLDDFNFREAENAMWMRGETTADRHTALVYNDYPGGFTTKDAGGRIAQVRLEEHGCARHVIHLAATIRTLVPGYRFKLVDHPTDEMNREYLITHVAHRARQTQSAEEEAAAQGTRYEAEIRAIPADVPFRPPRRTQRPVIIGSQTAVIVGPQTEEIYTDPDGYGRVKVRFHWDISGDYPQNASCWVRVSQGWAGGGYGMLFLPRVGQEVIVGFLEGDPSRPLITGRVYNHDHMPPYKLPDQKTISTIRTCSSKGAGGANEIRFDDAKRCEQLLLFAKNSLHVRAGGSRYESIGGDRHLTVGRNSYELVKEGKHVEVTLDKTDMIGGDLSLIVHGDQRISELGRHEQFVTGSYIVYGNDEVYVESNKALTLYCLGNFIKIDEDGVTIVGKKVKINSGGEPGAPNLREEQIPWPEPPKPADTTDFGHNTRYTTSPTAVETLEESGQTPTADSQEEETATSWIEIELVDELGRPVPREEYEIVVPNGQMKRGRLDDKGRARVPVADPGECQISFPKLDAAAWERR